MSILVIVAAGGALMGSGQVGGSAVGGGPLAALMILIGGSIYVLFVGGFMYLGLGIYQNTKRTAEALERQFGG